MFVPKRMRYGGSRIGLPISPIFLCIRPMIAICTSDLHEHICHFNVLHACVFPFQISECADGFMRVPSTVSAVVKTPVASLYRLRQVSDAVVDACFAQDPKSHVACETCTGFVMVFGEITTNTKVDYEQVVCDAVQEIGGYVGVLDFLT